MGGDRSSAKRKLHHGSMWVYLNDDHWDDFVLKGLGYQGRRMMEDGEDLKVFEIGSGTGAALATVVRKYKVAEVHGLEPAKDPAKISEKYFEKMHKGLLKPAKGTTGPTKTGIIVDYASKESMGPLPDEYYHLVMANGVLCYIPDVQTLKEVIVESMRILKVDGIFSATVLLDDEVGTLGYNYGSVTLTISQTHFWEALADELGYAIISIDYMGMWPGFGGQRSRYAIQLRKLKHQPTVVQVTDLTAAEKVSVPTPGRQCYEWILLASGIGVLCICVALAIYFRYMRKAKSNNRRRSSYCTVEEISGTISV